MIVLNINNKRFNVFESWSEITVKLARELYKVSNTAPEELLYIYNEQTKGKEADKDQINLRLKTLEDKEQELDGFYLSVFKCLSDIDNDTLYKTEINDVRAVYTTYLMPFVFGVLHFPIDTVEILESFNHLGTEYFAPEQKKVMGIDRPFYDQHTSVFTDASDVDSNGRKGEHGRYAMAELITAIVYRPKNVDHSEKNAYHVADYYFKDILTCDIFHAALHQLSTVNNTLQVLSPNLYQSSGDMHSKNASGASGLDDFGWLNSIMSIAEMGVLNVAGLTPLESVRQSNLYDFMTVLSNMRANNDYQKIYRENANK